VGYFQIVPPGTTRIELQIYDSAAKLDGISTAVQIVRVQSEGGPLQVMELYAVQNQSQPPRTLAGSRTYEIGLPDGATLVQAAARSPNGQPINLNPAPVAGTKGIFALDFPLRPGETQFEVAYQLPYGGLATLHPRLLHDVQHFVAIVPKSMKFTAAEGTAFSPMPDPGNTEIEVITNAKAGKPVAFTVSSTSLLTPDSGGDNTAGPAQGPAMGDGPGGGLGKPIDSPDPLSRYRWPLLALLSLILVGGGCYIARHEPAAEPTLAIEPRVGPVPPTRQTATKTPSASPANLLATLKEEMFQLEVERQQGRLSDTEYAEAKAALDLTLQRALQRARTPGES
jgi:hypothetical protein